MSFEKLLHGQRRHRQREPARPGHTTSTSRTRSRRPPSPRPASRPSTAASAAASSTSSPSRAATCFSGSFRDTLNNDNWRTLTPFETTHDRHRSGAHGAAHRQDGPDLRVHARRADHEGPAVVLHRRPACRRRRAAAARRSRNIPYTFTDQTRRYEGKVTYSINSNHRFEGAYTKIIADADQRHVQHPASMDLAQPRHAPAAAGSVHGSATTASSSPNFFVEGARLVAAFQLHRRRRADHRSDQGHAAARSPARQHALLVADLLRRLRPGEARQHRTCSSRRTYFLSTEGAGSHNMVFGYDTFNDKRFANNHQSGSDYRIFGTTVDHPRRGRLSRSSSATARRPDPVEPDSRRQPGDELPDPLGVLQRQLARQRPPDGQSRAALRQEPRRRQRRASWWRTTARSARASASSGIRPGDEQLVGHRQLREVRLGDLQQHRRLLVAGRQPADLPVRLPRAGDQRRPRRRRRATPDGDSAVFNWYNANGGANLPLSGAPTIPGVTPVDSRARSISPNNLEYAAGVSRQLRQARRGPRRLRRIATTATSTSRRSTRTTGRVQDQLRQVVTTSALIQNTNDLKRRYPGVTVAGHAIASSSRIDVGATYTLSRTWGNFDGENVGQRTDDGRRRSQYPEYKQAAWNYPTATSRSTSGTARGCGSTTACPRSTGLTVSVLQTLTSGVPYGARRAGRDAAVRDQSRLSSRRHRRHRHDRGDLLLHGRATRSTPRARRAHRSRGRTTTSGSRRPRSAQPFVQLQVLNLFNQFSCAAAAVRVQQRRRRDPDAHRSERADGVDQRVAVHGLQSVHHDAGGGHELALGPNFGTA